MKQKALLLASVAVLALGLAGCGKNESATTSVDNAEKTAVVAADAASEAAETAKREAAKIAEAAKAEAAKVADTAKTEAAKVEAAKLEAAKLEAARVEAAKTQEMIVEATSLVTEGRCSDASTVLQQLAGKTLSSDQQKLVDGLKEQIQKALVAKAAQNAADNAGDLLKM